MDIEKYLPIGTVLMLKDAKKRIMIIGYLPVGNKDGKNEVYDYAACLYPEGIISSDKTLLFNHDQIGEIYFIGNNDEEAKLFIEKIKDVDKNDILKEIDKISNDSKKADVNPDLIIED